MNPFTAEETAELYWLCLRDQRNAGLSWDVFKRIPVHLQRVSPLERRLTWRSPEPGLRLLTTMRVYSAERAAALLTAIEYDILAELSKGYDVAKQNFITALRLYSQHTISLNYYYGY